MEEKQMANLNVPVNKKEEPPIHSMGLTHVDTSKLKGGISLTNADFIPANWEIIQDPQSEDALSCRNLITSKVFKGTRKQFSAMLRGE